MAALNITETESVAEAKKIIEIVLREGYDPNGTDVKSMRIRRDLQVAKDGLNVVHQMKGHYYS